MTLAKKIVCEVTGLSPSKVSVRKGRGTARHWLYITTRTIVDHETQVKTEKRLLAERQCGTRLTDHGIDDDFVPCVLWLGRHRMGLTTCDMHDDESY